MTLLQWLLAGLLLLLLAGNVFQALVIWWIREVHLKAEPMPPHMERWLQLIEERKRTATCSLGRSLPTLRV